MVNPFIQINDRKIGRDFKPFVIPEIGINHEGNMDKAIQMVDDAAEAGAECAKFQCHIIEDEMIPNNVIPGNADESIWNIMDRCKLSEDEEKQLKTYVEKKGMLYLSTPFSRAAADRLEALGVDAYKIGSGECNNYPLIKHIAKFNKPIILSTGMNDIASITPSVEILRSANIPYAITQCTSMYPTPYTHVFLGALAEFQDTFPDAVLGLSDHSLKIYTCLGAAALGASILEKHFTSDMSWAGPDVPISITPNELKELIEGSEALFYARGGSKQILDEENPTIQFAYACVVSCQDISKGEKLDDINTWVKRPGTGAIKAKDWEQILGRAATTDIPKNTQLSWDMIHA